MTAPRLELPVYLIQGRDDLSTPIEPARAGSTRSTRRKRFVVIDDAGHFTLVTYREAFVAELLGLLDEK